MSYTTVYNSFMSEYLLKIYIYSRLCRSCIINVGRVFYEGVYRMLLSQGRI